MKKILTILVFALLLTLFACTKKSLEPLGSQTNKKVQDQDQNVVEILVDGGGANASFNSTQSMTYDKYANPYPYNTLEQLANEWNEAHPGYKIKIASSSMNNDRETMVPALNQGTAPEIIYYLGTTITEDMNKGWFVDLKDYLDQPNKYSKTGETGSVKWSDIYGEEYYSSFAPNGARYTAELELNAIGIVYNKTLFDQLGIEEPETFYDFMVAQDTIYAYAQEIGRDNNTAANYLCPYMPYYPWYDIVLETQLYSEYIDIYDMNDDGVVNGEEFARAFMKKDSEGNRLCSPDDNRSVEKARLTKVLTKYYPANFESYYAEQQFVAGNLVMMEAQGGTVRKLVDAVDGEFEIGFFSYPYLTTRPSEIAEPEDPLDVNNTASYYTKYDTTKYVRRGLSGYSSGWAVTSSAVNKGQDVVDACVDFLMFVTCYENNDRLINDKGFSIPLSGNTTIEYFKSLADDYKEDSKNENAIVWAACSAQTTMTKSYYDAAYLARIEIIKQTDFDTIKTKLASLKSSYATSINNLYKQNSWDTTSWSEYTGDPIY